MNNAEATEAMRLAIRRRDLAAFQTVFERRLDLWTSNSKVFFESRRKKTFVTLLHKLATSEYVDGLRYYLQRAWQGISNDDAATALSYAMNFGTSLQFIHTLLEAAVVGKPPYIPSRVIYFCAMIKRLYDLAERSVRMPDFSVKGHLLLRRPSRPHFVWDLPLHDAVANHQVRIVEMLVVERNAAVDSLSIARISPLMVACHLVYPNAVVQLLRHGANPNFPPVITYHSRVALPKLTKRQARDRGVVANLPMDRGLARSRTLSEKADYILELLIEAGLTNPKKRFIQHSSMKRHLSQPVLQRLKRLNTEVRSLKTLALVKFREMIRRRCNGVQFFATVGALDIPDSVKKQITFRVRP